VEELTEKWKGVNVIETQPAREKVIFGKEEGKEGGGAKRDKPEERGINLWGISESRPFI